MLVCHGIIDTGTIRETNLKDWDVLMNINVRAVFGVVSLCVPFLKERKGTVTILSGACGMKPVPGFGPFSISKAMVNNFIECAALELAYHSIRVNGVAPGLTWGNTKHDAGSMNKEMNDKWFKANSEYLPLEGAWNDPIDVAQTMVWLASDLASYCNGEIMVMDAGANLTGSNYPYYDRTVVNTEKNKIRIGGGLIPISKSKYNKELMGRDVEDIDNNFE